MPLTPITGLSSQLEAAKAFRAYRQPTTKARSAVEMYYPGAIHRPTGTPVRALTLGVASGAITLYLTKRYKWAAVVGLAGYFFGKRFLP